MYWAIGIFGNHRYLIDYKFSISQFIESILCLWMARDFHRLELNCIYSLSINEIASALICVDLPFICDRYINQKNMQFKSIVRVDRKLV